MKETIELTDCNQNKIIFFTSNICAITKAVSGKEGSNIYFSGQDDDYLPVKESIAEIMIMLDLR